MSDIHALSGAYAVDALDEHERRLFERHLAECAECRAEVSSLQEAAALLSETTATPPPAHLRDSVLAGISTVRPLPPETSPPSTSPAARRTAPVPRILAAAAAVAALIGGGVLVATQPWEDEPSQHELTAAERVVRAEDARSVTVEVGQAKATLYVSDSLHRAALVTEDMPAAPEGQVYALWLQKGSVMVPAGEMTGVEESVLLDGDTEGASAVGITVEPEGPHEEPSDAPIALLPLAEAT